jgi:cell division protein FtsL
MPSSNSFRSYNSFLMMVVLVLVVLFTIILLAATPTLSAHSRRRVTVVVRSAEDKYDRSITTFDKSKKNMNRY